MNTYKLFSSSKVTIFFLFFFFTTWTNFSNLYRLLRIATSKDLGRWCGDVEPLPPVTSYFSSSLSVVLSMKKKKNWIIVCWGKKITFRIFRFCFSYLRLSVLKKKFPDMLRALPITAFLCFVSVVLRYSTRVSSFLIYSAVEDLYYIFYSIFIFWSPCCSCLYRGLWLGKTVRHLYLGKEGK